MNELISSNLDQLKEFCKRHRAKALYVFGSVTRDDFDSTGSDLDFVVEFLPQQRRGFADVYVQLVDDLEAFFGCHVDLIEREPLDKSTNHICRQSFSARWSGCRQHDDAWLLDMLQAAMKARAFVRGPAPRSELLN